MVVDVDKNPLKGPVYANKENRWKFTWKKLFQQKQEFD